MADGMQTCYRRHLRQSCPGPAVSEMESIRGITILAGGAGDERLQPCRGGPFREIRTRGQLQVYSVQKVPR